MSEWWKEEQVDGYYAAAVERVGELEQENHRMRETKPHEPDWIPVRIGTPLREVQDLLIRKTLEATKGNKIKTAQLLGINPRTIYRKLESSQSESNPEKSNPQDDIIQPLLKRSMRV